MLDSVANLAWLLVLGFFLGMRHATDADHVVAIATIVARQRTLRGSALIGAAWGVGHTITIIAVGAAIILFGVVIPPRLGLSMEFAVGVMLVLLGALTLTGTGRVTGATLGHSHSGAYGDNVHSVGRGRAEERPPLAGLDWSFVGGLPFYRYSGLPLYRYARPLIVGLVHGLAGSAAVALLVLTIIRDPAWAMGYLLLFGVGTIGGMMLITLVLAAPFASTSRLLPRFNWQLRVGSGLVSFGFGLVLVYTVGFSDGGLFTASPSWVPH